jgi:hypothetical protein
MRLYHTNYHSHHNTDNISHNDRDHHPHNDANHVQPNCIAYSVADYNTHCRPHSYANSVSDGSTNHGTDNITQCRTYTLPDTFVPFIWAGPRWLP